MALPEGVKKVCSCEAPANLTGQEETFPPEKYKYCHSYCCVCCPHARVTPCDKEQVDGNTFSGGVFHMDKATGKVGRWLPESNDTQKG